MNARRQWICSIVDEQLVGGSVDVAIVPLNDDKLFHSFRPLSSSSENRQRKKIKKKRQQNSNNSDNNNKMNASKSLPSLLSNDIQRKQDHRIKKSAELANSSFLTENLPLLKRLPTQSEWLIEVEYLPTDDITLKVRHERRSLLNGLTQSQWGSEPRSMTTKTSSVLCSPEQLQKIQKIQNKREKNFKRKDEVIMKRAKLDFEFQQKKITKLVKNEMKSIRRIERRNTVERQRRFLQIISVATSVLLFQRTFHSASKNIKKNNAALKIQKFIHNFFRARMQTRVDHVRTLLGMRVVMVISNLRAKVKKTAARVVTQFIIAIPASTKALVALRLMRKRCIRIQRWWRSFLSCKISKIRSLLRRWCLIEREHRIEIKKMVSNKARAERRSGRGERERDQMMLSLTLSGGLSGSGKKNKNSKNNKNNKKNNTFQDNIEAKEQSKKLDRLANKTSELYQNQYGNNNSMMTTKKLLHRESRKALNLSYLMESVIRPTMQISQKWLDDKFMVQSASKMLLSIVAEKKEKKERKKKKLRSSSSSSSSSSGSGSGSGNGSVEKLSVGKKKRLKAAAVAAAAAGGGEGAAKTNYSWEWDHWLSILKEFETIDIGMGVVIRSEIPFEMRVAIIKNMLEKERKAYVRRFVSKSVDIGMEDVRPLVSLHSIKFLRDNQLSVIDLFERQSQPVFKVFTSRTLSQNGIMMAIVQVLLHIKY